MKFTASIFAVLLIWCLMDHSKFIVTLFLTAFFVVSCTAQPFATAGTEIASTSSPLSTGSFTPTSVPSVDPVSIASQTSWVISAESCALANGQLSHIPTPEAPYTGVDFRGQVNRPLGGGVIQDGDVTIELVLHCDDSFGPSSMEPYFASDINHLAVFINWRYEGILENAPMYIIQGLESKLSGYVIPQKEQALNGGFGISRGLFLNPSSDFSSKTTLRFVYITLLPSGDFSGAVLSFDLQQVSDGLQPSNVSVSSLSDSNVIVKP